MSFIQLREKKNQGHLQGKKKEKNADEKQKKSKNREFF